MNIATKKPSQCERCKLFAHHVTTIGDDKYVQCCSCYIADGNPPADWHSECMEMYEAKKLPLKIFTVGDLIKFLQRFPQHILVGYQKYSECCLLDIDDISLEEMQPPRGDGWIHEKRPDKPSQEYLIFPGN